MLSIHRSNNETLTIRLTDGDVVIQFLHQRNTSIVDFEVLQSLTVVTFARSVQDGQLRLDIETPQGDVTMLMRSQYGRVHIGIVAPREIDIVRTEVLENAEKQAAHAAKMAEVAQ